MEVLQLKRSDHLVAEHDLVGQRLQLCRINIDTTSLGRSGNFVPRMLPRLYGIIDPHQIKNLGNQLI